MGHYVTKIIVCAKENKWSLEKICRKWELNCKTSFQDCSLASNPSPFTLMVSPTEINGMNLDKQHLIPMIFVFRKALVFLMALPGQFCVCGNNSLVQMAGVMQPALLLGLNPDWNFAILFFNCSWNICTCFSVSVSCPLFVCHENEKLLCKGGKSTSM